MGHYKAPEVRGRVRADGHPLLREIYSKAEGFSVGIVMCDLLGVLEDGDVLQRIRITVDPLFQQKHPISLDYWVKMTETPAMIAHMKVFDRLSDTHLEEERRAEQGTISPYLPIFGLIFGPIFL